MTKMSSVQAPQTILLSNRTNSSSSRKNSNENLIISATTGTECHTFEKIVDSRGLHVQRIWDTLLRSVEGQGLRCSLLLSVGLFLSFVFPCHSE